ncbi:unnamed protein product, partial [Soboliphyme baturini]|uniref:CBFD_NFYB_HMF domain-containing protein n=1 Tax=Soboliphyme baturini TaxID=241478 RepID=A0A183IFG0_9BILA
IKEARRSDAVSPGPKSKLLESVSWPDAAKIKVRTMMLKIMLPYVSDAVQDAEMSGTQEKIIIGAASKGIIEREFQHNAQIFHQLYQPNPFASTTDDEIKEYMKQVGQKPSGAETAEGGRIESVSLMQAAREHHAPAELDESPVGYVSI